MWLLIDDMRTGLGCDVVAKNGDAGKSMLACGDWEGLCLDHDLGEGPSGRDVLRWALEWDCLPPVVQLITSNPVGRQQMAADLMDANYQTKDGFNFTLAAARTDSTTE